MRTNFAFGSRGAASLMHRRKKIFNFALLAVLMAAGILLVLTDVFAKSGDKHTVTFTNVATRQAFATQTVIEPNTATPPQNKPSAPGYTFQGAYQCAKPLTMLDGTSRAANTNIPEADIPKIRVVSDITLRSVMKANVHKVTFTISGVAPGGAYIQNNPMSVAFGSYVNLASISDSIKNWKMDNKPLNGGFRMPDKDVVVTGEWASEKGAGTSSTGASNANANESENNTEKESAIITPNAEEAAAANIEAPKTGAEHVVGSPESRGLLLILMAGVSIAFLAYALPKRKRLSLK